MPAVFDTHARNAPERVLFVRTYEPLKGGGPTPPIGLAYLTSPLERHFGAGVDVRVIDSGLVSGDEAKRAISEFAPRWVGLSGMSCEIDRMRWYARAAKELAPGAKVIAGGPHATIAWESLLRDPHFDLVSVGESERTMAEVIETGGDSDRLARVAGLASRNGDEVVAPAHRDLEGDLDELPFPSWARVPLGAYAAFPNWNGTPREAAYAPIVSSRGCPYHCSFCHSIFGKRTRFRSAQNVFEEMVALADEHGIREFHFLDDIFNLDVERASALCRLIIDSGRKFSLAFPNGLRPDIMTKELVSLLRAAGTYRVQFGFESFSPRLQKETKKHLDIEKALDAIRWTSASGIITGAYFMFGFPTQTRAEALDTIEKAAASPLDVAYFFKATPYPGSGFFDALAHDGGAGGPAKGAAPGSLDDFTQHHFFSVDRSYGLLGARELNELILLAQRKFYLRIGRLWRGFRKAHNKRAFLSNLLAVSALVLQGMILTGLAAPSEKGTS